MSEFSGCRKLWRGLNLGVIAIILAMIGATGCSSPDVSEKAVSTLSEIMPRDEAVKEVKAKGPRSKVPVIWERYEATLRTRVDKVKKQKVAIEEAKKQKAESLVGARERWDKWVASGKAKGHLLEHLLVMRKLGQAGVEKAVGTKFRGQGPGNLSFETPKGVRVTAAMYGDGVGPLTGFIVEMVDGSALTQQNVLAKLGLPASEFRAVRSNSGSMYRWKKLAKGLGYGDDIAGVRNGVVVFWQGP